MVTIASNQYVIQTEPLLYKTKNTFWITRHWRNRHFLRNLFGPPYLFISYKQNAHLQLHESVQTIYCLADWKLQKRWQNCRFCDRHLLDPKLAAVNFTAGLAFSRLILSLFMA